MIGSVVTRVVQVLGGIIAVRSDAVRRFDAARAVSTVVVGHVPDGVAFVFVETFGAPFLWLEKAPWATDAAQKPLFVPV